MTAKLVVLASFATSLASCAAVPLRSAAGRFSPGARDEVFSRAVRVATSRGFVLALVNREEGIVSSQPSRVGARPCAPDLILGVAVGDARDTLQVLVQQDGTVTVALQRECAEPHHRWSAARGGRVVAAIEEEQRAILAEVLGQPLPAKAAKGPEPEVRGRER